MGIAFGIVAGLGLLACGDGTETAAPAEEAKVTDGREASNGSAVVVKGFIFKPSPFEVKAGTEVTWTNEDQILHTVTAGTPPDAKTGVFRGELAEKGATFSFTFADPGTYPYFCERHNSMTGSVVVG